MNNKLFVLMAAGAFALTACNSPTAEQEASETVAQAEVAAQQAGDAVAVGSETVAAEAAASVDSATAVIDEAVDPIQAAYEEGKANAAATISETAGDVQASMADEAAEAEAEAKVKD